MSSWIFRRVLAMWPGNHWMDWASAMDTASFYVIRWAARVTAGTPHIVLLLFYDTNPRLEKG